jgi:hypothetical protein
MESQFAWTEATSHLPQVVGWYWIKRDGSAYETMAYFSTNDQMFYTTDECDEEMFPNGLHRGIYWRAAR